MSTANYTSIEIRNGNEYRMLINNRIYDKSMFFYPVFKKSAEIIKEICSYDIENKDDQFALYYPNNIIMYCAERGGGKSTAMISFAAALKYLDPNNEDADYKELWGDIPDKYGFTVLDVIDPTTIFEKEIFMRIILSKMFSELRALWSEKDKKGETDNNSDTNRNQILSKFRKCYGLIDVLYHHCGEFDGSDDLEELADLGDSTNLKKEFKELVDCFLKQFNTKRGKNYLVIQIDDADLNCKMAYQIIEDIRKYCIIPNVIVLMAVNMEQMHQIIEQHFVRDFKTLLRVSHGEDAPIVLDDTKDMAVRYINKLMPSTHQIHLPKISEFLRNNNMTLKLTYMKKIGNEDKDLLSYPDSGTEDAVIDYQERLIRLIYKKTGVILVKTKNFNHNFLPQNLRELSHFLSYFCSLPDLDNRIGFAELFSILGLNCKVDDISDEQAEAEFEKRRKGIDALEQYLVKFWSDINLSRKDHRTVSALADTVETIRVSSAIKICEKWKNLTVNTSESDNIPPISYNSYTNLMNMLTQVSRHAMSDDDFTETYRMVYALQLLFTTFLHKETLMCIRKENFERLYKVVSGELWTYYSSSKEKLMGRFKVDYRMLLKLDQAMALVDDKQQNKNNTLSGFCYLRTQNSNLQIDESDPQIFNALKKLETGDSDDVIIYDVGISLFNTLTNKANYSSEDANELIRLNKIYDFLMNWDVRHYVEKSLNNIEANDPWDWQSKYLGSIDRALTNLDLIQWKCPIRSEKYNDILKIIYLSNNSIAKSIVEHGIKEMMEATPSIPQDLTSVTKENMIEMIDFNSRIIGQLKDYLSRFEPLGVISPTIKKLSKEIELIEKASDIGDAKVDGTGTYSSEEIKGQVADKIKNRMEEDLAKLLGAVNRWKNFIYSPGLLPTVESEIDTAFTKVNGNKRKKIGGGRKKIMDGR